MSASGQSNGDAPTAKTWPKKQLRHFANLQLGKMLDKEKKKGTPTKYLRNVNVRWFAFDLADLLEMPFTETEQDKFAIRDGDIMICEGGEPGRAAVWTEGDTVLKYQKALHRVRLHPGYNPRWITYQLYHLAQSRKLIEHFSGTTIKHLPQDALAEVEFLVPPEDEQRRIVTKLDTLFERSKSAREDLARIPRLVERYKQAVLKMAFKGTLTTEWRDQNRGKALPITGDDVRSNRETGFQARYELPLTWRWVKLGSLGVLDRGRSRHRPRNAPELYGGPYPFVQTGDIRAARGLVTTFEQTYSERGLAQSRLWPKGTLCITIAANIAETAILGLDACFPDSIVGFKEDPQLCRSEFIELFIRTVKDELADFAPATAQKNINLETLRTLHVPCPPVHEQDEIVRQVKSALKRVDEVTNETSQAGVLLERLEQATLARAFRGELLSPEDQLNSNSFDLVQRDLVIPTVV